MLLAAALLAVALSAIAGCGPTYPKCDNDKDCHEHEFCVNGSCQQCRDRSDCNAGQACNKGRCQEQPATSCSDDVQCPSGQSCIEGVCKACASDDQCGAGGKCNAGRCARASSAPAPTAAPQTKETCQLEPVYFDFNESALSTEATGAIDRDAECLKTWMARPVTLTGHTDPRGTEEYNIALSDKRAQSVRERLTRIGVDPARIKMVAKGELESSGTDESGWVKDRRVDVSW
jgi:peptidoglycan-associated lipoprotein